MNATPFIKPLSFDVSVIENRNDPLPENAVEAFTESRRRKVEYTKQDIMSCFTFTCRGKVNSKGCGIRYQTRRELSDHFKIIQTTGTREQKKQHKKFRSSLCQAECKTCLDLDLDRHRTVSRTDQADLLRHVKSKKHKKNLIMNQNSSDTALEHRSEPGASTSNNQEKLSIETQQPLYSKDTPLAGHLPVTERETRLLSKEPVHVVGTSVQLAGIPVRVIFRQENRSTGIHLSQDSLKNVSSGMPDEYTDSSPAKIKKNDDDDELSQSSSKKQPNEIADTPVEETCHCNLCADMVSNLESVDPTEIFQTTGSLLTNQLNAVLSETQISIDDNG